MSCSGHTSQAWRATQVFHCELPSPERHAPSRPRDSMPSHLALGAAVVHCFARAALQLLPRSQLIRAHSAVAAHARRLDTLCSHCQVSDGRRRTCLSLCSRRRCCVGQQRAARLCCGRQGSHQLELPSRPLPCWGWRAAGTASPRSAAPTGTSSLQASKQIN